MTVKLVDEFVRKDGWTREEFLEHLREDHADLVEQLPNLQQYAISVPADLGGHDAPFPDGPEDAEYDAIVELYFESVDDLFEAFESEVGERLHEDAGTFLNPEEGRTYLVEVRERESLADGA